MTVGEFLMKLIFFSGISQKEAAEKIKRLIEKGYSVSEAMDKTI